jgi:hypothetical protein
MSGQRLPSVSFGCEVGLVRTNSRMEAVQNAPSKARHGEGRTLERICEPFVDYEVSSHR